MEFAKSASVVWLYCVCNRTASVK